METETVYSDLSQINFMVMNNIILKFGSCVWITSTSKRDSFKTMLSAISKTIFKLKGKMDNGVMISNSKLYPKSTLVPLRSMFLDRNQSVPSMKKTNITLNP